MYVCTLQRIYIHMCICVYNSNNNKFMYVCYAILVYPIPSASILNLTHGYICISAYFAISSVALLNCTVAAQLNCYVPSCLPVCPYLCVCVHIIYACMQLTCVTPTTTTTTLTHTTRRRIIILISLCMVTQYNSYIRNSDLRSECKYIRQKIVCGSGGGVHTEYAQNWPARIASLDHCHISGNSKLSRRCRQRRQRRLHMQSTKNNIFPRLPSYLTTLLHYCLQKFDKINGSRSNEYDNFIIQGENPRNE